MPLLTSGRRVTIRQVTPMDTEVVQRFVRELGARTRYYRYCSAIRELPDSLLARVVNVDGRCSATLLAMVEGDRPATVAMGEYHAQGNEGVCEIALVVADDWQREGLGTLLLRELAVRASSFALRVIEGFVLYDNAAMLGFARRHGFRLGPSGFGPSIVRASKAIEGRARLREERISA